MRPIEMLTLFGGKQPDAANLSLLGDDWQRALNGNTEAMQRCIARWQHAVRQQRQQQTRVRRVPKARKERAQREALAAVIRVGEMCPELGQAAAALAERAGKALGLSDNAVARVLRGQRGRPPSARTIAVRHFLEEAAIATGGVRPLPWPELQRRWNRANPGRQFSDWRVFRRAAVGRAGSGRGQARPRGVRGRPASAVHR